MINDDQPLINSDLSRLSHGVDSEWFLSDQSETALPCSKIHNYYHLIECNINFIHIFSPPTVSPDTYCFGRKFVKVLTQDSALLYGVIAYARPHYNAG